LSDNKYLIIVNKTKNFLEEYGEHVTSLVNQVLTWCDQHDAPVLVPYTTWLDTPESLLVTKIEHAEGILKLAVTSFNQHVFFSNSKNEICMYHIPSKKMVRRFSGHADVINFLLISHNNRYLISGSSDKLIKVWNLGNGEMENTFK
jgi:WD40 repeat protein